MLKNVYTYLNIWNFGIDAYKPTFNVWTERYEYIYAYIQIMDILGNIHPYTYLILRHKYL